MLYCGDGGSNALVHTTQVTCTTPNYNRNGVGPRPNSLLVIHSSSPKWKSLLFYRFCNFFATENPCPESDWGWTVQTEEWNRPWAHPWSLLGKRPHPQGTRSSQASSLHAGTSLSHTGHHHCLLCTHCHLCHLHCPGWGQLHPGSLKGICIHKKKSQNKKKEDLDRACTSLFQLLL